MSPPKKEMTETDDQIARITSRLDAGSRRMKKIEDDIRANTVLTQDIHDLIVAAKVGFKVLGYLGAFAKWLGIIAGALVSVWAAIQVIKNGGPPPHN